MILIDHNIMLFFLYNWFTLLVKVLVSKDQYRSTEYKENVLYFIVSTVDDTIHCMCITFVCKCNTTSPPSQTKAYGDEASL